MVRSETKSVTVTKKESEISIVLGRSSGAPGSVQVRGAVFTAAAPFILGNVRVELWVDGIEVDTALTEGYMGTYTFNYTVGAGTYKFQTKWDGDATYFGAESEVKYGIYDKIGTAISISVSPSWGAPPLTVGITGLLTTVTGLALGGKTVYLYRNGLEINSQTTKTYTPGIGAYTFSDIIDASADYYVEFEGDDQYEGCEEEEETNLPCTICGHQIPTISPGLEVECQSCHSVFETVIV